MKSNTLFILLIAIVVFMYVSKSNIVTPKTPQEQLNYLISWIKANASSDEAERVRLKFMKMSDTELAYCYLYVSKYLIPKKQIEPNNYLKVAIRQISEKYNIFS